MTLLTSFYKGNDLKKKEILWLLFITRLKKNCMGPEQLILPATHAVMGCISPHFPATETSMHQHRNPVGHAGFCSRVKSYLAHEFCPQQLDWQVGCRGKTCPFASSKLKLSQAQFNISSMTLIQHGLQNLASEKKRMTSTLHQNSILYSLLTTYIVIWTHPCFNFIAKLDFWVNIGA